MAYCIMMLKKVKTKSQLHQMYIHHYRELGPANADPALKENNDIAVPVQDQDFIHSFTRRLNELPYYQNHNFRKNGVMAYDIVFEYSAEAVKWIDTEKWKQDNIKWLEQEFGKENIVSVVYHYDEASYTEKGVVHGHAVVIPVDEKGKINASRYTGGRQKLAHLQDSYADIMRAHNLQRGLRHSAAIHTDIKKYYAELTNAIYGVPFPERKEGEPEQEYIDRVKDAWRTERAAHLKELKDKDRKIIETMAKYPPDYLKDVRIKELTQEVEGLKEKEDELVREFGSMEQMTGQARAMQMLNTWIQEYPDDEAANTMSQNIVDAIDWVEERQKKKDKAKSEQTDEIMEGNR